MKFIIYSDLEYFFKKERFCYNNSERSSTTEKYEHTPFDFSMFTNCSFDATKPKPDSYRGKDYGKILLGLKRKWKKNN